MSRSLVAALLGEDCKLKVPTLDPAIQQELQCQIDPMAGGLERGNTWGSNIASGGNNAPLRSVLDGLQRLVGDRLALSSTVLVCNTPVRFHLRRLLEPFIPRIVVLSPLEIPPQLFRAVPGGGALKPLILHAWPPARQFHPRAGPGVLR
jgi:flagellar biosynthesis protein FlhA